VGFLAEIEQGNEFRNFTLAYRFPHKPSDLHPAVPSSAPDRARDRIRLTCPCSFRTLPRLKSV
jgi:hypothetical protein